MVHAITGSGIVHCLGQVPASRILVALDSACARVFGLWTGALLHRGSRNSCLGYLPLSVGSDGIITRKEELEVVLCRKRESKIYSLVYVVIASVLRQRCTPEFWLDATTEILIDFASIKR